MTYADDLAALDEGQLKFLAGVVYSRGKFYIGHSERASGTRFSPSVSIELSYLLDEPYASLFDGPHERRYYGHPVSRYVVQDKDKIVALNETLRPHVPPMIRATMDAMTVFCSAQTEKERRTAYETFSKHRLTD